MEKINIAQNIIMFPIIISFHFHFISSISDISVFEVCTRVIGVQIEHVAA